MIDANLSTLKARRETMMSLEPHEGEPLAADVIKRMKEVAGLRADMHLASALGTTRANVAKWKARNSVPYREAVIFALRFGASLDYILLGRNNAVFNYNLNNVKSDYHLIFQILKKAVDRGVIRAENGSNLSALDEARLLSNAITLLQSKMLSLAARIELTSNVSRQEAVREAIVELGFSDEAGQEDGPQ